MDEELIENPELDLSGDDSKIIERYLAKQEKKYLEELEKEPMDPEIEAVITVPAYQKGKNLQKTLENYAKIRYPEKFEIVIFENHPQGQPRDETREIVEKFKANHPNLKIRLIYKVFERKPTIGEVRKYLVDSVLLRK